MPDTAATQRPTTVPSTWPTEAELSPLVVPRYPAVPNTDDRPTLVPGAAS